METSLFKAISDFSYVSRLTEPSLLCKHWLPWSQTVCSLHLPTPFNKFFTVLAVLKSLCFLKAHFSIGVAFLFLKVQNCILSYWLDLVLYLVSFLQLWKCQCKTNVMGWFRSISIQLVYPIHAVHLSLVLNRIIVT